MRKKVKEIIEIIETDGWYFKQQKGSHKQYYHMVKKGCVTIPDHGKNFELDHFIVSSILKTGRIEINTALNE